MTDYSRLIDAETWAFIRETERWYPADTAQRSIEEQRAIYDAMCRAFDAGRPERVRAADHRAGAVALRHYQRAAGDARAVVLYLHGGGFVVGGLESHDDVCAEICDKTGFDVVSVDYRLCPEHPHPAAHEDAVGALARVREQLTRPVILAGDSAGGNLAAALAHGARGDEDLAGQVLIYPGLGGDRTRGSYITHAQAPMLTADELKFHETVRAGGQDLCGDASFAPLWADDFSGLPPTYAAAAECDPLADDARAYAEAIHRAGGQALWHMDKGLVHGHLRARHGSARAKASFERVLRAIRLMGAGEPLSRAAINGRT